MNIACWITASRMVLLPVAVLPLVLGWSNGWLIAAAVCTVAGLSDAVDGYVARRVGCVTAVGGWLDLISDKLFVSAMLGVLAWLDVVPFWVLGVVVAREIAVTAARLSLGRGQPPAVDVWGKVKMAVSVTAIVLLLLRQALSSGGLAGGAVPTPLASLLDIAPWALYLAVALTVLSGVNYLARYAKRAVEHRDFLATAPSEQPYAAGVSSSSATE